MGRRIELSGYGSLTARGWLGLTADLEPADGRQLTAGGHGAGRSPYRAMDQAGGTVGEFRRRRMLSRNGDVDWRGVSYDLSREKAFSSTYVLARHERELLRVRARAWGREPVDLTVVDTTLEPGLVLFVVWLAQRFSSEDAAGG